MKLHIFSLLMVLSMVVPAGAKPKPLPHDTVGVGSRIHFRSDIKVGPLWDAWYCDGKRANMFSVWRHEHCCLLTIDARPHQNREVIRRDQSHVVTHADRRHTYIILDSTDPIYIFCGLAGSVTDTNLQNAFAHRLVVDAIRPDGDR